MSDSQDRVDMLVIGTGIAGCCAALAAADSGVGVTLVSRLKDLERCSTAWAQGGIICDGPGDSPALLAADIDRAGHEYCNPKAVRQLGQLGPDLVRRFLIERVGVRFDTDESGEMHRTQEGAHSVPRIVHVADATGREIQRRLLEAAANHKKITLRSGCTVVDLLTLSHHSRKAADRYKKPTCVGAYLLDQESGAVEALLAKHTVLASGGLGQIFLHTSNPPGARGDGVAMAYRAGVRLLNLEYVQFHPTVLYHRKSNGFLISEALRGEGARLALPGGDEYMHKYHKLGALAPRDVVARANHEEMLHNESPCVYLDISHKPKDWIRERFPTIYKRCKQCGIDMTQEPIPVVPAAHYACGGVAVDLKGRANMRRLWAVGEVSCTGVHGANRLASTSLLEGLVWGARCGREIARLCRDNDYYFPEVDPWRHETETIDPALIHQDWQTIKQTMWNYVGLVRTRRRMKRAYRILRELRQEVDSFYARAEMTDGITGLRNGVIASLATLHAAFENRESRGTHYRVD